MRHGARGPPPARFVAWYTPESGMLGSSLFNAMPLVEAGPDGSALLVGDVEMAPLTDFGGGPLTDFGYGDIALARLAKP